MTEFRQSHFIFLTRPRLLLLFLLVPSFSYGAGAQSPTQPIPLFASQHQNWDPSIIIVAGSLVFVLFVLGVLSIFFRTCSETVDYERNPFGGGATRDWPCFCSQGIEKGVIDTFPILVYSSIKDLKIGKEALECAVCLSEFHDMDRLRLLPKCNHVFHPGCIDAWLISHVTCPVCRGNLNTDSGEVEISVLTQLNDDVLGQENGSSSAEIRETEQQTVMSNVKEEQRITINEDETTIKQNLSPKSRKFRKLSKSNSTGHSLIEPEANMEMYTLRLHEDLRTYILLNHGIVERCASQHVLGNRKKGYFRGDSDGSSRSTRDNIEESGRGERQERRVFSMNPPFVSWGWGSVTANSSNTGFEK